MSARAAQLTSLTSVRGIAAWLVVLYHVRSGMGDYLSEPAMAMLAKGYLAVDLFFMLSGFVLWFNYAGPLRAGGIAAAPGFYWRRLARIWPLHAFILTALLAFALLLKASGRGNETAYPLAELPLHLAMLQNWGFTPALSWNHPAWSISCEFAAYLFFPLLVLAIDWGRTRTSLLLAALVAFAVLAWHLIDTPYLGDDIVRLGLWRCLIEFAMGTILCALWQRWRTRTEPAPIAAGVAAVAAASWTLGLAETFVAPLFLAALLAWFAFTNGARRNPLRQRSLVWLGEISYATYLVHFPLFILFKLVFVADATAIAAPRIALYLGLVLVASAMLHRWVEKPAQRALNRIASNTRRTAMA